MLEPQKLNERIDVYFEMRSRGALVSSTGKRLPQIRIEARDIYRKLLSGPQRRSDILKMFKEKRHNIGETTLRHLISQMSNAGLVNAPARQPITLALSPSSIELLFPHLW